MPSVISEGRTRAKAEENLKDALELMIETNRTMTPKDAVGNVKRAPISVYQRA